MTESLSGHIAGTPETIMRVALESARRGMLAGEPPVGASLVCEGQIITTANNAIIGELDATAHAELCAIRTACRQLRRLSLEGCELYVTVEPCPMCIAACHYAGIRRVVFGASLDDIHRITGDELRVSAETMRAGGLRVETTGGCLAGEARALLHEWAGQVRPG